MIDRDESEYHLERARVELDLGFRSEDCRAAEAHIRLSALHMQRMKELDQACGGTAPAAPPRIRA